MTYAMTLDNSWELMTEDEMYDVNGGGSLNISISKEFIVGAAQAIATGGTAAALAYLYPTLTVNIAIWLLVSTSLGPVAMGIMASFAAGAVVALGSYIVGEAAKYLAGKAYDAVFTVASGFFVPNITLKLI